MTIRILNILLFWTIVLAGTKVFAADTQAVDVRLQAFQVVAQDKGGEKLVPALEAEVGDTIEYQITYQNQGKTVAQAVAATLPVPEGAMSYLAGSAAPKAVQASLDGKTFAPCPSPVKSCARACASSSGCRHPNTASCAGTWATSRPARPSPSAHA